MQPETQQQGFDLTTASGIAKIGNQLLLLGQAIAVFSTEDQIIIFADYIKLIAGFLFIQAVNLESKEQQIAPGITTPLNQQKMIGTVISVIGAIILTIITQKEASLRAAGITPQRQPIIPPFTAAGFVG